MRKLEKALEESKAMNREAYRNNVKRVWELKEFDPDLPSKTVAARLGISYYLVQKILKHKYQPWYQEELDKNLKRKEKKHDKP